MNSVARAGLLFILCGLGAPVIGAVVETPAGAEGVTVVSAEQAKALMEQGALMVDARVALEYVEEHIAGAVSIPYKEKSGKRVDFDASQDRFDIAKLPADLSAGIIFYCNAEECWKSYKASVTAVRHGYTDVYWLRGGLPEWKSKGMAVAD